MIVNTGWFFYLESFLLISGISGFSFFTTEHIRKPGIYRKSHSYSFLKWDFSPTKFVSVSFSLVKCLVTFMKFSISVISGVSGDSAESTWPSKKLFLFLRYVNFCIFVFPSFYPVSHCFRGWSKKNLNIYDVINCLNKNLNIFCLISWERNKVWHWNFVHW